MIAGRCALDAEQPDELLAVFLLALAAERARGAFEIGRQVGDAGLDHRIDDALRLEEGKSEGRVIPRRGVEARVPRAEGRAAIEGGAKIVRRVVPIQDRAVGMPCGTPVRRRWRKPERSRASRRRRRSGKCRPPSGRPRWRPQDRPIVSLALNIASRAPKSGRGRCSQPRPQVRIRVTRRGGGAAARQPTSATWAAAAAT